jgi:pyruvate formate lyase activating enzyme
MECTGTIFNIQHFSVNDGPGIRTIIFFKGCPLRCRWCSNPESQQLSGEIAWTKAKCIGCQACRKAYGFTPQDGKLHFAVERKLTEGDIQRVCPTGALHYIGEQRTVSEILAEVEKDSIFYGNSSGGLTLSGGEPLLQPDFALALLKEAGRRHIHRAIETTGHASWEVLKSIAEQLDYVLYDIKLIHKALHQKQTGVSNERILDNFRQLYQEFPELTLHVRTPVIPDINDSVEQIGEILDFLSEFPRVRYELLPYHRLGEGKYTSLGRKYPMQNIQLAPQRIDELYELVKRWR